MEAETAKMAVEAAKKEARAEREWREREERRVKELEGERERMVRLAPYGVLRGVRYWHSVCSCLARALRRV
eukprot:1988576-Rhodomonas_salina.1